MSKIDVMYSAMRVIAVVVFTMVLAVRLGPEPDGDCQATRALSTQNTACAVQERSEW